MSVDPKTSNNYSDDVRIVRHYASTAGGLLCHFTKAYIYGRIVIKKKAVALSLGLAGLIAPLALSANSASGAEITSNVTKPLSAISMGDSYISGEAGRWQGNSNNWYGSREGTDRAYTNGGYNPAMVYLWGSYANNCHRSDVSEIQSAPLQWPDRWNLACSGAVTQNLWTNSSGGVGMNGEQSQAERLRTAAAARNVKLIALSIGGNDLGFSNIISDCVESYIAGSPSCAAKQQTVVNAKMPNAFSNVRKTIDEIRAVMTQDGYKTSDYKIILQSYPAPLPRSSENRYSESGSSRVNAGCPMYNVDLDWARNKLVPQIASGLRAVASQKGVTFLDLSDAFQGREACSKTTSLVNGSNPPSAVTNEWVRFVTTGALQGQQQESLHPNAFGQKALGVCLAQADSRVIGSYKCTNTPGKGTDAMTVSTLP
ncbi:GDSL-type esterase/lipase family protein [Streptomyces collinus]|uniref:GDSL-type esterase/lipase family protein n=1 Tax=Streptomyces collinus TaxID=42684 RepID=UPI0036E08626